jgi:hypothetical protein
VLVAEPDTFWLCIEIRLRIENSFPIGFQLRKVDGANEIQV